MHRAKIKQYELAAECDITQEHLSRILNGVIDCPDRTQAVILGSLEFLEQQKRNDK